MVPASCSRRHALLLGRDDVERQHRQHRAVHGHRHAHLVERDAVEQLAHVVDRVDGDARHADVAGHPRVVAVVAAVGGQVERDRQALLPGREVAPVEGVGLLGGGEPGVLADRPRLVDVHRRVRPAQVRRAGRDRCRRKSSPSRSAGGVERLDVDALGRVPGQPAVLADGTVFDGGGQRVMPALLVVRAGRRRLGQLDVGEIGDLPVAGHRRTPSASSIAAAEREHVHVVDDPLCRAGTGACGRPAATTTVDAP